MGLAGQLGRIAPNYKADLVMLDLHALPFTPMNDLRRQLVYCETGGSVRLTMVAGKIAYRDGCCTLVDESALLNEARSLFSDRRQGLEEARRAAGRIRPFYEEMLRRAEAEPLGLQRRLCAADYKEISA
jgi:hypothetical protein